MKDKIIVDKIMFVVFIHYDKAYQYAIMQDNFVITEMDGTKIVSPMKDANYIVASKAAKISRVMEKYNIEKKVYEFAAQTLRQLYSNYFKFGDIEFSEEQKYLLYNFHCGKNIICNAVAGAGKTTSLLMCADKMPGKRGLLLTYNKSLQNETKDRAQRNGIPLGVRTFHSMACVLYGKIISNDIEFTKNIDEYPPKYVSCDYLFVDEAQDLTITYYKLIYYIIHMNKNIQVIIVGDIRQTINEYKGALSYFIENSNIIYDIDNWANCNLTTSYRISRANAHFINTHLYNDTIIRAGNKATDVKPKYIVSSSKEIDRLVNCVKDCIQTYGINNVMILAPSNKVKSNYDTILQLCTKLSNEGYKIHKDNEKNSELLDGKLAIISYNASKGMEKDCVILLKYDENYFKFYNKLWMDERLPNVLTVAATRAKKELIIYAAADNHLRSINLDRLEEDTNYSGPNITIVQKKIRKTKKKSEPVNTYTVDNIVSHQNTYTLKIITENMNQTVIQLAQKPSFERYNSTYKSEDIKFIFTKLFILLSEINLRGTTSFSKYLEMVSIVQRKSTERFEISYMTIKEHPIISEYFDLYDELLNRDDKTLHDWCIILLVFYCMESKSFYLLQQLKGFEFDNIIFPQTLDNYMHSHAVLYDYLTSVYGESFEFIYDIDCTIHGKNIIGYVDIVNIEFGRSWGLIINDSDEIIHESDILKVFLFKDLCKFDYGYVYLSRSYSLIKIEFKNNIDFSKYILKMHTYDDILRKTVDDILMFRQKIKEVEPAKIEECDIEDVAVSEDDVLSLLTMSLKN